MGIMGTKGKIKNYIKEMLGLEPRNFLSSIEKLT